MRYKPLVSLSLNVSLVSLLHVAAADPVSENRPDCMHVQLHMVTTLVAGLLRAYLLLSAVFLTRFATCLLVTDSVQSPLHWLRCTCTYIRTLHVHTYICVHTYITECEFGTFSSTYARTYMRMHVINWSTQWSRWCIQLHVFTSTSVFELKFLCVQYVVAIYHALVSVLFKVLLTVRLSWYLTSSDISQRSPLWTSTVHTHTYMYVRILTLGMIVIIMGNSIIM